MLTLCFSAHCLPCARFENTRPGPQRVGQAGALTVALLARGEYVLPGVAQPSAEGSLVLANGPLVLEAATACRVEGVCLTGAAADEVAGGLRQPVVLGGSTCFEAVGLLQSLLGVHMEEASARASALAYSLLCALAGSGGDAQALPDLVRVAIAEMREHYGDVYGVEELATGLGVSKSHLIRVFHAATGRSPGRYLTDVRIEAARRLLLNPAYSLEAVAVLCGFSGANYLCRVFKKETGETPAVWRGKANVETIARHTPGEWEESLYL